MEEQDHYGHWDGYQWVPENWISFDVHYGTKSCVYFGPGLYRVPFLDDFSATEIQSFQREVFEFIVKLACEKRKPILTY